MITVLFRFGGEVIIVVIRGTDIKFGTSEFGVRLADISGLKLNYQGVCREFPDLETHKDWRGEAIKRFKEKIISLESDDARAEYIADELSRHGYIPISKQKDGFRPERLI